MLDYQRALLLSGRCSCAVPYPFLQKRYMSTVSFNNINHFQKFRSLSGDPRVTVLMLDHHLNFECVTSQGLLSAFGLFQGYSLGYS